MENYAMHCVTAFGGRVQPDPRDGHWGSPDPVNNTPHHVAFSTPLNKLQV
jgi:hypothetical protein